MIRRRELYDRECVAGLIHVIEQVPLRTAVRRPLAIHRSSVGLLLLWSVLRWERTFLIKTLERLGVDLWALTRDVDEALTLCSKEARETGVRTSSDDLDPFLRGWLNRAAEQARALHHDFLGGEHLLLALLADGDSELAVTIFRRNGLGYDAPQAGRRGRAPRRSFARRWRNAWRTEVHATSRFAPSWRTGRRAEVHPTSRCARTRPLGR